MKKSILILSLLLISLFSKSQYHIYSDSLINYSIYEGTSPDSTYLYVTFCVVESPNKYGLQSISRIHIVYAYSSSAPMSDNTKKVAIKASVDAWVNKNYPTW